MVEHGASVLKNFDTSLGQHVAAELRRHGVQVVSGVGIEDIVQEGAQLRVGAQKDSPPAPIWCWSVWACSR